MKKYSSITRVNSHRISRNKRLLRIGGITILILIALWVAPKLLAGAASLAFTPVHAVQSWLAESGKSFPYFFRDRQALIDEITDLRQQTPAGSSDRLTIAGLWSENQELRRLVGGQPEERILAGVIARPTATPYDVLVIDQGSQHGVVPDAPVFVASSTVIGFVKNVKPRSATVELITTPSFRTSVYVYGPNIYTNAEGMGGGVLRVGVPQGITISTGDTVVLPSVELGVFGTIDVIESEPTSPEQYGFVTTDIPLQHLRLVTVGRSALTTTDFAVAQDRVAETTDTLFAIDIPLEVLVDITGTSTATSSVSTSTEVAS